MLRIHPIWGRAISLGLWLATAQVTVAENPPSEPAGRVRFQKIEQPWPLKVGVTLGGIGLIGLELWWFLGSKTKAQAAKIHRGIQELNITVDGGYLPDRLVVKAGQPVRLNFWRQDPSSCLEKVVFPDFHQAVDLALNQKISVEFTPEKPGSYPFHCGMNMFRGLIEVISSEVDSDEKT